MDTKTLPKLFFFSVSVLLMIFHVCPSNADWTIVTVDDGDVGWYTSIALFNDNPRISYHEGTNLDLQYAWCDMNCDDTTSWDAVIVDSSGDVGRHSSLFDSSGTSHISYYDETTVDDGDLKYASCTSGCNTQGNWLTETVDSIDDVGLDTSLALDGLGNPHISYFDATSLNLKYAFKNGGSWNIVTVDTLGTVGEFTSLALNDSGKPRISYHGNNTLKYALCDTGCDTAGNWTVITVDSVGSDVGEFTSLVLDSSGRPRISYASFATPTNGDLKYATCDSGCDIPGNWTTETVDSAGNTGWDTSLALDGGEIPHIAYYRFDLGNLLYAKLVGSTWEPETVDSIGDVGEFCSLALDSNDDPHISYYDFDNEDLKYALLAEPCLVNADCNDSNDCTDDTCNVGTGECIFTPNSDPCDDGLFCTETDQCSGGACVGSGDPCTPPLICNENNDICTLCLADEDCNDDNDCTDDTCNVGTGECIFTPNSDPCDDGLFCTATDQCTGGACVGSGDTCDVTQVCDEDRDMCYDDSDSDGVFDNEDNCIDTSNPGQEDTFPPQGNGIGDACDCEADFNCDGNVDATDVDPFLLDFGRSTFFNPCTNANPCNGDFDCNVNVDALDVDKFLEDFGRSLFNNPCPACVSGDWCVY